MIFLCDYYNQASKDLAYSLQAAGNDATTVVINPDGFLPQEAFSPFTYYVEAAEETGKPRFFNQVPVPAFWEISGNNQMARVSNLTEERARITYPEGSKARIVKSVEWLDKSGKIRQVDHYNKYGFCFAKTTHDENGQALFTSYQTKEGDERILENHLTGDILLTLPGQALRRFANRTEFIKVFLAQVFGDIDHIIFNSLATPFIVSWTMENKGATDVLVWQEPLGDVLPGNMNGILEDNSARANAIIIPDKATYEKALTLAPEDKHHKILSLGYAYDFKENHGKPRNAFIATNSDQIERLEALVESLPDVTFQIAAVTEMSPRLLSMMRYSNVVLHPNASHKQLDKLYQESDLYLDINHHNELYKATRTAFENQLLILAFSETAHGPVYTAPEHIYASQNYPAMVAKIKQVLDNDQAMQEAMQAQKAQANTLTASELADRLQPLLGGNHV